MTELVQQHNSLRTERLVVAGSAVLFASFFGNGLNYLFGIFLARSLGVDEFGLYVLGVTFFSTVVLIAPLGMDTGTVKFISELRERHDLPGINTIMIQAVAVTLISSLCVALGLVLLAPVLSDGLYDKPNLEPVLRMFSMAIPFAAVTGVLLLALQAHQTVRPLVVVRYLWEPIGKFVFAALVLGMGWGMGGVLGAIVVTMVGSLLLAMGFVYVTIRSHFVFCESWTTRGAATLLTYCLPLALATVLNVVTSRADIFMLGFWVHLHEIGIYQAAFQTAAILALILGALETSLMPFFGQVQAQQDKDGLKHLYQTASKLVAMCTIPLCVILAVFSREVLALFGPDFAFGGPLLVVLAVGQLLSSAGGSPNNLLLMGGHSRLVMWNTICLGLFSIVVFAILIPVWGIWGAAIGSATIRVLVVGVRILEVWHLHRIQPFTHNLVKPVFAGLVAAVFAVMAQAMTPHIMWPVLACVTGIVYVWILAALKLEAQDRQVLDALFAKVRTLVAARV